MTFREAAMAAWRAQMDQEKVAADLCVAKQRIKIAIACKNIFGYSLSEIEDANLTAFPVWSSDVYNADSECVAVILQFRCPDCRSLMPGIATTLLEEVGEYLARWEKVPCRAHAKLAREPGATALFY